MQGNINGMYNAGGQQGFGGNTFTGNLQQGQGFGGQVMGNFNSMSQPASFYPQWFAAYTGRQPMQVDQMINMVFNGFLNTLYQNGIGQQTLGNLQQGEIQALMNKVRTFAFIIMVDKTQAGAQQQTDFIIQRCVEVVLFGEMVKRAGGPHMPIVQSLSQAMNVNIADRFQTYAGFESNPNAYAVAIQNAENNIRAIQQQQQQNAWQHQNQGFGGNVGFGSHQQIHPSAAAAVPSGNFSQYVNQGQQVNTGGQFAVAGNQQAQANATINQIGQVASSSAKSVYAIALEQQRAKETQQHEYVEQRQAESVAANVAPQPADNVPGVCSAFTLAAMLRKSGESPVQVQAEPEPEPEPEPAPVEVETPAVVEQPVQKARAVIPNGWTQKVEEAMELADPTPSTVTPPPTGLPSIGLYNFSAGNPTTMDDFAKPATVEEHSAFGAKPTHTFEDDACLEEDDFLNAVEHQMEAEIQSMHSAERADHPLLPTSTMDDLVQQGQAQNLPTNIEDQELRIDYGDLDSKSRKNICKKFHIRVVPAYVKGRDRLIQIVKGKTRTIIVERNEDDVNYAEHETELNSTTPVFATWDAAARNIGTARTMMKTAAEKPVWSTEALLEKLDEKLKDAEDTSDAETKLAELLTERSIIKIDGALTCSGSEGDYQNEVLTELVNRGVDENVGTLLDNSLVEYERFETSNLAINDENKSLISAIVDAQNSAELIGALNAFRKEATLPVRELARLHHRFTKYLNQYLKLEFSNGWETTDPIEDFDDLIRELLTEHREEFTAIDVMNKITLVYTAAARKAYTLLNAADESGAETFTVGTKHSVALLPMYYSQYPIASHDDVGAVKNEDHPELYELLNKLKHEGNDIKIVTLDNYALTFVRSLGDEDLFYLVEIAN